jgi:hypothetical protein
LDWPVVKLRLDPADEYLHPLEEATNFNESMYFNAYDPLRRVGGFLRLGNRPNEGHAEMTVCLYLPDGRVAFMFGRPAITGNDAFDAGGMRFAVVEPFVALHTSYAGKVVVLDDPLALADPGRAFRENAWVDAAVELTHRAVSPVWGGEPVNDDGSPLADDLSGGFARGHYEQHMAVTGSVRVGDEAWDLDGFGLRDHSWGPRYWQVPWYYRWLTANFGADFGFVISVICARDGSERIGGMVLADGAYEPVQEARIQTDWEGADRYHRALRVVATTPTATYEIAGRVRTLVPLRNRRTTPEGEQLTTRIAEGLTEWRCAERVGYGLSEYLDQVVDGVPVGAR